MNKGNNKQKKYPPKIGRKIIPYPHITEQKTHQQSYFPSKQRALSGASLIDLPPVIVTLLRKKAEIS